MSHAAAERNGEVSVIAADALALAVGLPCGLGRAGMLVAEGDVAMDEIADRLDARPPRRCPSRTVASAISGKSVGLAIAATQEIDEGVRGQVFNGVLNGRRESGIRQAAVTNHAVGGEAHPPLRRDHAAAPVAEHVAIGCDLDRRHGGEEVRHDDIGGAGEMRAQHHDHRRWLREIVEHFESDTELHRNTFPVAKDLRWLRSLRIQGFLRLIRSNGRIR